MNSKVTILLFVSGLVLARGVNDFGSEGVFTQNVQASANNLGGVNCLVNAVFDVENVAEDFIYNIQVCHVTVSDVVKQILKYSKVITKNTAKVITADDNPCNNAAYNESDAKVVAPAACTTEIKSQMGKLYDAVYTTYTYLNTDITIEDSCSNIAAQNLKLNLPIFAQAIDNCAILFAQF